MQEAADAAERIMEAIGAPLTAAHKEVGLRCSLGIAIAAEDGTADADELIRDADAAMYIAKRDGKGGYRLFEPEMHEGVLQRLELRTDLQRALAQGQLELYYQPVIRLGDGSVSGVEALLRWNHPERGMVGPDQFIPLAEESGLIVPIGRWVLRQGCREGRRLLDGLTGRQAGDAGDQPVAQAAPALRRRRRRARRAGGVRAGARAADAGDHRERPDGRHRPGRAAPERPEGLGHQARAGRLRHRLLVAVLPVEVPGRRPEDGPLVPARGRVAAGDRPGQRGRGAGSTLSLEVVAEGIELQEQWTKLRDLGCDLGQGFYFAKPMDAESARSFLAKGVSAELSAGVPAGDDAP